MCTERDVSGILTVYPIPIRIFHDEFFSKHFRYRLRRIFKKSESVVGIDVGSAFLKVVQLKKRGGKAVLETYGELALGPYADAAVGQATSLSPDKIAEALKDIFREANVTGKKFALSIPFGSSLLSVIHMPEMNGTELARMVPIEARKYIPVPISEVVMDWWVVPSFSEPSSGDMGETPRQQKA